MDATVLLVFVLALAVAAGSPGPSVAALVANVLTRGWRAVMPFTAAMWIGELIWLTCAIAGLAALAEAFHGLFLVVKYLGVLYLAYLAWKMWHAPVDPVRDGAPSGGGGWRMFLVGLSVTLGNPKIMAFYLALLPTIIALEGVGVVDWMALAGTMLAVLVTIDLAYVVLAARARTMLRSRRARRAANRASAVAMGSAAAAIASR